MIRGNIGESTAYGRFPSKYEQSWELCPASNIVNARAVLICYLVVPEPSIYICTFRMLQYKGLCMKLAVTV
jgi:hypothetical protein